MVFRIVLMVILNASNGLFLKSFLLVRPIYSVYHQIIALTSQVLKTNPSYLFHVNTCMEDEICNLFVKAGRSFFLVDLSISFFFYFKFDSRFKERFELLITNIKNKIKSSKIYKKFQNRNFSISKTK